MIPKRIITAWFGRGEKSDLFKRCMASWPKMCPDWEIVEVNEDTFPDLMATPYMEAAHGRGEYVKCTELARLWGVHELGGIYLDCDVGLVGSPERLRGIYGGAFFCLQADGLINGAAFGAEAGNRAIAQLLSRFPTDTEAKKSALDYGPMFLSAEHKTLARPVWLEPKETFFPYHFNEPDPSIYPAETIGVHRWCGSWARQP